MKFYLNIKDFHGILKPWSAFHGQVWNAAEPARALGVSESTTRRHLYLLTDAFYPNLP